MFKFFNLPLQSVLIFLLLLNVGFWLAAKKPLWVDEAYTQLQSVQGLSYAQMLAGHIPEGSVCPLFYIIQKFTAALFNYTLPSPWDGKSIIDAKAQFILRIAPNVCMSLAVTILFYFFARSYSWGWGIYALVLSLSSFMVWTYWVEARPYALWFLLTTLQLLIFIKILADKNRWKAWFSFLTLVHFLLALTVTFSIIQIALITLLLWLFKDRQWKKYIFLVLAPMAVSLFYYSHAPKYIFWLNNSFWDLISLNMSPDIFWICAIYVVFILACRIKAIHLSIEGPVYLLLLTLLFLAAMTLILGMTYGHDPSQGGFGLSMRYFIFLTPAGIIAAVVLFKNMVTILKKDWWYLTMLLMVLGGLLVIRCLKAYTLVLGWYAF